jgi:hypothetical protein
MIYGSARASDHLFGSKEALVADDCNAGKAP